MNEQSDTPPSGTPVDGWGYCHTCSVFHGDQDRLCPHVRKRLMELREPFLPDYEAPLGAGEEVEAWRG